MNKLSISGRLVCWLLLIQEFDLKIIDKLGKANVVADFLSRPQVDDPTPINDSFLDDHFFFY